MIKENITFEEAILRLEEITHLINSGKSSLDDSLKLYEEADLLMEFCEKKLFFVEKRMSELMKKHDLSEKVELESIENKMPLSDIPF